MSEGKASGRRKFLKMVLAGAGAAAAFGLTGRKARAAGKKATGREPILYRRTKEVEKYYKTLYI